MQYYTVNIKNIRKEPTLASNRPEGIQEIEGAVRLLAWEREMCLV
jgi:hypothetical protein